MPGFSLQSSELGPPTPLPAGECCPPQDPGGGTYSLVGEERGEPIWTRGQTLWYSRYSIQPLRVKVEQNIILFTRNAVETGSLTRPVDPGSSTINIFHYIFRGQNHTDHRVQEGSGNKRGEIMI
jgi:hypothetical protein